MKKRVFAFAVLLALCLAMLPVSALAGDPSMTAASAGGTSPLTGDDSNVTLWIVIGAVAALAIVGIVIYFVHQRKKRG